MKTEQQTMVGSSADIFLLHHGGRGGLPDTKFHQRQDKTEGAHTTIHTPQNADGKAKQQQEMLRSAIYGLKPNPESSKKNAILKLYTEMFCKAVTYCMQTIDLKSLYSGICLNCGESGWVFRLEFLLVHELRGESMDNTHTNKQTQVSQFEARWWGVPFREMRG